MKTIFKVFLSIIITVSINFTVPVKADLGCCLFSIEKITPSIVTLMKGTSYTYQYNIKNTCSQYRVSNIGIHFSFLIGVESITPSAFTLYSGNSKIINVKFKMPLTAITNSNVNFSFKVESGCSDPRTVNFTVKAGPTCSFSITKNAIPATIATLEKGKTYYYYYTLRNTSTENVTFNYDKSANIDIISNIPCTLNPGATKTSVVRFTMPSTVLNYTSVTFTFHIKTNCNSSQTVSFVIKAMAPCGNFTVSQTITPLQSMGKGCTYTYAYSVKNLCSDSRSFTTEKIVNIVSITPASFSLTANESKIIQVKFLMPANVNVGSTVTFSFAVNAIFGNNQTINQKKITFYIKVVSACCSFTVLKNATPASISSLAIGHSYTYKYTIKNTCTATSDRFTFTLSNNSTNINLITPNSFDLGPGQSKIVDIKFTMPNVALNTSVAFSFKVTASCFQEPSIYSFHVKATKAS